MAIARRLIVDPSVTPWYHCISRCVRNTIISDDLKELIIKRMIELSDLFTIDVASYSLLDTHMHHLLRIDEGRVKNLTRTEVLMRWAQLHPPRGADRKPLQNLKPWLAEKRGDHVFVNTIRKRLCDLGWYMKELKEWSALKANELDRERGVFWSGRYKSIAVLDEPALLATSIYIDLNCFAAGICRLPEESTYSSLFLRWQARCFEASSEQDYGHRAVAIAAADWLCPLHDNPVTGDDGDRAGLIEGLALDTYLTVLDETSRMNRVGKASLSAETQGILQRLKTNLAHWQLAFSQLESRPQLCGVYYAFGREALTRAAEHRGCAHVANLNGMSTDVPPRD